MAVTTYVATSVNARHKAVQRFRHDDPKSYINPVNKRVDSKFTLIGMANELCDVIDSESVGRRVQVKNTSGGSWPAGTLLYLGNNNLTAQTSAVASNNPAAGAGAVINVTGSWEVGMTVQITDGVNPSYAVITATNPGVSITVDLLFYSYTGPIVTALPAYIATAADQSGQNHAEWVLSAALANNGYAYAYDNGEVIGLNTNALNVGNLVYLSTAGAYTTTAPATGLVQVVGVVKVKSATVGSILFFPGNKRILSFGASAITPGTSGQILMSNATPATTWTTMSGNVTISATGVTTIGALQVTNAMLAGSIDLTTKVGGSVLPIANGGTNTNATLNNNRVMVSNGGIIAESTSTGDVTASAGVTTVAKINTVALGSTTATSGNILIANGTQWVSTAMSGNVTITSGGVTTIGALQVTNAMLAGSIDLTTKVGGTVLPIANGGTNTNAALNGGRPIISTTTVITESSGYQSLTHSNTPYTVIVGDCMSVIDADASAGVLAINLPAVGAGNKGFRLTVRNVGTSGTPTVVPNGTDGIDGTNVTHTLNKQNSHIILRSTGTAGAGANQGWVVEDAVDWVGGSQTSFTTTNIGATTAWSDLASITLTPGEWDVTGGVEYAINGSTGTTATLGISTTSGNSGTGINPGDNRQLGPYPTASANASFSIASWRLIVTTATQSVFLKGNLTYSAGTPQWAGRISARRVR